MLDLIKKLDVKKTGIFAAGTEREYFKRNDGSDCRKVQV